MNSFYARILTALLFACSFCSLTYAQDQELVITGKVVAAEDGSGLPGVNVVNVTRKTGAQSDIEGMYKLKAMAGDVLEFRFLGYTTETRTVGTMVVMDVTLKEETRQLKEAVVIGYGVVSKKDLTGSIAQVSSKDFQTGTIGSPEQLIQGKVAGVQITSAGGAPGDAPTIRIRGGASLRASNDPLYVVDGVPLDLGGVAESRNNPLNFINPNDIESFVVLKDASATAIYGSRASNGVILITTKKGAKGSTPTLNYSNQTSIGTVTRLVDVLSGDDIRRIVLDSGSASQIALLGKYNTNWQKVIYQQAITTDNNLSYSGSAKNLPYRISGGWFNQQGLLRTDKLQRQTIGIALSPTFFDNSLQVTTNFRTSRSINQFAEGGAIGAATSFDPTQPIYNNTGRAESQRFGSFTESLLNNAPNPNAPRNPLGLLKMRNSHSEVYRTLGNVTFDYWLPFVSGLRVNLNLGFDKTEGRSENIIPDSAASAYLAEGSRSKGHSEKMNQLVEFYLDYGKDLPTVRSRVDFLIGASAQDFTNTYYNIQSRTFKGDSIRQRFSNDTIFSPLFPFDKPQNRLQSYYSRVKYTFAGKVFLQFSIRRDGSSRFGENNRFGLFPAAALSYKLSEEPFMKKIKVISMLKPRVSWGVTGQQDGIGNYDNQAVYSLSNNAARYQFGNRYINYYRPSAFNPNLRWEETTTYNAGLDFGFFNDRLTGSIDFYRKDTKDLLNRVPSAAGTNFSDEIVANIGSVENKGIEFGLNGVPIQTEDIQWNIGFNVTYNENKITKLNLTDDPTYPGIPTGGIAGGISNNIQVQSVGFPLNSFYVYKQVYQNGKPVEGVFQDLNGDGKLNEQDLYRYKQAAPPLFFGFSTQFTYRKISLMTVLRANVNNYVYNNVYSNNGSLNSILGREEVLTNASSNYLETGFTGNSPNGNNDKRILSDHFVQNASFLRMDNLSLSYDFGAVYDEKAYLRINANVQNVFVHSKYKGIDPEISSGIDNNFYPRARVYTVGVNFTY